MSIYLTEKLKRIKIYFGSWFLDDTVHCGGKSMKEQLRRPACVRHFLSFEARPGSRGKDGTQSQTLNPKAPPTHWPHPLCQSQSKASTTHQTIKTIQDSKVQTRGPERFESQWNHPGWGTGIVCSVQSLVTQTQYEPEAEARDTESPVCLTTLPPSY